MTAPITAPISARRRRLAAAGLLTAAALAGAGAAVLSNAAADAAAPHAHRIVGTRGQVPWSKVGSGWTLATWARSSEARTTLFLVDGRGNRWSIARLAKETQPEFWSPDGRRALVSGPDGQLEVDLHTGRTHRVPLGDSAQVVSYSRPRGLALLATVQVRRHGGYVSRLERFGTDGRHQLTYPASVKGAGALDTTAAIETSDGAQLVVGAAHGLVLLNNNGTVVRRLHAGTARCGVVSWWTRTSVLASCNGAMRSVPLSGGQGRAVTAGASTTNPFGYSDAWHYSAGELGLAPNGCGPKSLVRFDAHGNGVRIAVPSPTGTAGRPTYVGHHGDAVTMIHTPALGCVEANRTLFSYNAVTHRSTALLGPAVNGGTVLWAVPWASNV